MWRVISCGLALILAGCGASDCEIMKRVAAPSSGTEPGTLQAGMLLDNTPRLLSAAPLAARSDGSVMCLTCLGIATLDAMLDEVDRIDTDGSGNVAIAPDDASYVATPGSGAGALEIVALSPSGEPRWRTPIESVGKLVAGTEGLYARTGAQDFGSSVTPGTVIGFDAATGESRTLATGQYLLGAAHGGVFVAERVSDSSLTLRQLDPTGNVVWSRAITAATSGLSLREAVVTPDGGAIVLGVAGGTLDFGDRALLVTGPFVAGFDASGATQWAFNADIRLDGLSRIAQPQKLALTTQGEILITSRFTDGISLERAVLSVATPAGISRNLDYFARQGTHTITGLAAAPDGAVWVQVDSGRLELGDSPSITIGDHTFTEEGMYLFKLVP